MALNFEKFILFHEVEKAINLVKSTLGPRGMDKLLITKEGGMKITNDGATVLKSAYYHNIIKNILNSLIDVYDNEVGDGKTSLCCLVGELVSEAKKLILARIHPQIITKGYKIAAREFLCFLKNFFFNNSSNPQLYCENLIDLAKTALCSKVSFPLRDHFAKLTVEAILKLNGNPDINCVKIIKKLGSSLQDSFLEDGFILENKIGTGRSKRIENAKILIANTSLDSDKIKIYGTKLKTITLSKLAKIEIAEQKRILDKCRKIVSHMINVFVNRQLIYNKQESFLTNYGILSIEHADFEGIERLALITGAEIVSTFDEPSKVKLGYCRVVEEVTITDENMIRFEGCFAASSCTLILRGSNPQILDETERFLRDVLRILNQSIRDPRFIWEGGGLDIYSSIHLEKFSKKFVGKISAAILAFSRSIRNLVKIVFNNAELDSMYIFFQLKTIQENSPKICVDVDNKTIASADELGLIGSFRLKTQMIISAIETTEIILRIDKIL